MSDTLNIKPRSLFSEILILIKHRLSLSVVFSSVASYLIAFEVFSFYTLALLILGGFFVVGASNGFNQIIERNRDALMPRTQNRPLPTGGLSVNQAILACVILSFLGLFILYIINLATQNLEDVPFTNATVPIRFIFGALLLMTGLGTLIGFIPAEKAISIKPIEALREE